ncbi:MAG TPA: T9SS type A sorting domain-containing protein [Chitinophagales bacterium]|nr:T9SS type A sorting domain-containing protein [Chitinophagales bacterium]
MKATTFFFTIILAAGLTSSWAQNTWTQKANVGGLARFYAVGFSIGSKGYIGTGSYELKDFWEYDPVTDVWTQKADFGGTGRYGAAGFSIGNKGYVGTGTGFTHDFWEYNPTSNTWTQKADFPGATRFHAIGFSIDSKGYMGTGQSPDAGWHFVKDFWEYDPSTDTWTQKADFGGIERWEAAAFSIGNIGYVGLGSNYFDYPYDKNDFWEYDPATNTWIQKADFAETGSSAAVGFSIDDKGYIGTGSWKNDFWEYNPATDAWTQKTNFGGLPTVAAVGFSIGSKGYIGTGAASGNDFWEYTPDTSSCAFPSNLSVAKITSSSARLKWNAVAGAEKYKLRYKVSGAGDWITMYPVAHSKKITGLLPNTTYSWDVKTYCKVDSPNVVSHWSSKQDFTTAPFRMSEGIPVEGDESVWQISFQIYPNPAEEHATIQFTLPQSSHVYIKVYDVSGKEIVTMLDDDVEQGEHSLQLNTSDFAKGVYVVKMICASGIENQKLIAQ